MLEGTIDIVQLFGSRPESIRLSAVAYATGNGGALRPAQQCPAGDGDGLVEPAEFATVRLCDLEGGCCPSDLDGSEQVDFGDVALVLLQMGDLGGPADLDASGAVDTADVSILLLDYGPCP